MPKATRVSAEKLNRADVPIVSKIAATGDAAAVATAVAALEAALLDAHEGEFAALADGSGFLVPTRWEPPFKIARAISAKFHEVRVAVVADAFQSEYWLARAEFAKGRAEVDETLTFNDGDAFDALFQEIHGEPYATWRTRNKQGALRGGFSWGTSDDYDPSKSELGKAEGQV
jgi:hypothetical protein